MNKKLLTVGAGFLLTALIFAGVHGYAKHKVKQKVDEAIALIPFAGIEYEDVSLSLKGSVGLEGVTISPRMFPEKIKIGSIVLDAKSLRELLKFAQKEDGRPGYPDNFDISVNDLLVDLKSKIFASQTSGGQAQENASPATTCGGVSSFGLADLAALGYDKIKIDQLVKINIDRPNNKFRSTLAFYAENFFSFTFRLDLDVNYDALEAGAPTFAAGPKLLEASLHYLDRSYNGRKNSFCAENEGVTVEEYLDKHVELLAAEAEKNNVELSDEIKFSYKQFLKGSGDMGISVLPEEPFDVSSIMMYEPADLVTVLGPSLKINGGEVPGIRRIVLSLLNRIKSDAPIPAEAFDTVAQLLTPAPPEIVKETAKKLDAVEQPESPMASKVIEKAASKNKKIGAASQLAAPAMASKVIEKAAAETKKQQQAASAAPLIQKNKKLEVAANLIPEKIDSPFSTSVESPKKKQNPAEAEKKEAKAAPVRWRKQRAPRPYFKKISPSNIAKHIGRQTIIYTKDGRRYFGKITNAGDQNVDVLSTLSRGTIERPVRISDIDTAHVYF